MKKKLLLLATVIACFAIAVTGTLAYFSADDTAHNVITTGGVNIKVVEQTRNDDKTLVDFPEEGIQGVMPGTSVSKIVRIQNTGVSEAWIRVKMDASILDEQGKDLPLTIGDSEKAVVEFSVLTGWLDGGDGYWYYEKPVSAGEMTDILLEEVRFSEEMGNEYQNCTANLLISAEAVQTANNGETVLDAQGWPEE